MLSAPQRFRSRIACLLGAAALALNPSGLAAQDLSWASSFDAGGDEIYVAYTEPTIALRLGESLQPVLSLGAYYVLTPEDDSKGIAPAVGVRYSRETASLLAKLGWGRTGTAVTRGSAPVPTMMMSLAGRTGGEVAANSRAAVAQTSTSAGHIDHIGRSSGLTASLQGEFWGNGGWASQGIASYSWGADVLWSRARLNRQIMTRLNGDALTVGAEVVWQVETLSEGPEARYDAFQLGPVLMLVRESGTALGVSGGLKHVRTTGEGSWYARFEWGVDL